MKKAGKAFTFKGFAASEDEKKQEKHLLLNVFLFQKMKKTGKTFTFKCFSAFSTDSHHVGTRHHQA